MAPDSLKSESIGLLSTLLSTALDNCERAITGTSNSLASPFNALDISEISCCLLASEPLPFPVPFINCK